MDDKEFLGWLFEVQGRLSDLQQKVQDMIRRFPDAGSQPAMVSPTLERQGPRLVPVSTRVVSLSDLRRGDYRGMIPLKVEFPDGNSKKVAKQKEFVVEIARWHVQNGYITGDTPPAGPGRRYPVLSRDKGALSPSRAQSDYVQVDGWWVDTWGRADGAKSRNLVDICRSVGTDPSAFKITFIP